MNEKFKAKWKKKKASHPKAINFLFGLFLPPPPTPFPSNEKFFTFREGLKMAKLVKVKKAQKFLKLKEKRRNK
jgi:hypothetical protein